MIKVLFALDVKDDWPPVATEGVWCERNDASYKLLNTPFFIPGLARGDSFIAECDSVNGHIFDFKVIEESGHSVIWVINHSHESIRADLIEIEKLGCGIEKLEQYHLHSIDVPKGVNIIRLDEITQSLENKGVAIAYPVWRHD